MRRLLRDESGLATYEYALIVLLFSLVMVVGLQHVSSTANVDYNSSTTNLTNLQDVPP